MYRLLYMVSGASGLMALAFVVAEQPAKGMTVMSLTAFVLAYLLEEGTKE